MATPYFIYHLTMISRQVINLLHNITIVVLVLCFYPPHFGFEQLLIIPGFILVLSNLLWIGLLLSILGARFAFTATASLACTDAARSPSFSNGIDSNRVNQQPAFVSVSSSQKTGKKPMKETISLDSMILITGSAHIDLSKEISRLIGVPLADADLKRFADGEVSIQINENLRGKDVFIVQSCAAPVNDSIMELLLTVSCARYTKKNL